VVFGLIASLAVPQFGQVMQKLKMKTAGRDVVSAMRLARSSAVSQKDQFGVYFDYETNQYTVFHDLANPASFTYDYGQDSVIATGEFPGHVHLGYVSFPAFCVVFRPNGSASNSGNVILYSYSEEQYLGFMTVDVLGSTGRVRLTTGEYHGESY
jgi:hypothetical protein